MNLFRQSTVKVKDPVCGHRAVMLVIERPDEHGVWVVASTQTFCQRKDCKKGRGK